MSLRLGALSEPLTSCIRAFNRAARADHPGRPHFLGGRHPQNSDRARALNDDGVAPGETAGANKCLTPVYYGRYLGFDKPPHLWGGWADEPGDFQVCPIATCTASQQ